MGMVVDLSKYYTTLKITKRFDKMEPIKSTFLDNHFPKSVRQQYPGTVIPVKEISRITNAVPVVRRGAESIPIDGEASDIVHIEPLPVRIHAFISAAELNDLKLHSEETREKWAARKQEGMRQTVRLSTEVMATQAVLDGGISYPLLQANGDYAVYTVTYNGGQTIQLVTVAADDKWDAASATLVKIHKLLRTMATKLDNTGFGGEKDIYAGTDAFDALLTLIEGTDKPKVPVKVRDDGSISIGKFKIVEMAEAYRDPKTLTTVNKLTPGELRMISRGYTGLFYACVDDLDANLKALPMFIKAIEHKNPSGYQLVGESKPLPVVAPQATCKAIVVNP
jgi:hypothetical protein